MVSRRLSLYFTILCFSVTFPTLASAKGILSPDPVSLLGISTMYVEVVGISPEAEKDGLSSYQLQVDIELRLRKVGINVVTQDEHKEAILLVVVNANKNPRLSTLRLYSWHIQVYVLQSVSLTRNPNIKFVAPTWQTDGTGTVGEENIKDLRNPVDDMIDEFLNELLAANQKQR